MEDLIKGAICSLNECKCAPHFLSERRAGRRPGRDFEPLSHNNLFQFIYSDDRFQIGDDDEVIE